MFEKVLKASSWVLTLVGVCMMGAPPVVAQSTLIGPQFQVNVITTGRQGAPQVASDGAGHFIVSWRDGVDVKGRQVSADGALGPELLLLDLSFLAPFAMARGDSGEFVVVTVQGSAVEAQRFDAAGMSLGSPIVVSDDTEMEYRDPAVAAQGDDFVVVWATDFGDGEDILDILGRRLGADGMPQGGVFQVNDYTSGTQAEPEVAALEGGDFVVTWNSVQSPGNDDDFSSIQARAFDSLGQPLSNQFQVNTATLGRQSNPAVAGLADGSFAVVWLDRQGELADQDGGIAMQRANAQGQLLGGILQVNTYTTGFQRFPDVTALDDGRFVVAWESDGSPENDSLGTSILGRAFDASGVPLGDDFQVNALIQGGQVFPSIAGGVEGTWLATWESFLSPDDDSFESVQGQRLGPFTPNVFADGFESGNTASWSDAQP